MENFFDSLFGKTQPVDRTKKLLGEDMYLLYLTDNEYDDLKISRTYSNMGYLFKNDRIISNQLFRIGGLGGEFKDGFCKLINYTKEDGYYGKHCIINNKGKIVFIQKNSLDYPYHVGGIIAKLNSEYFNLNTGELIVSGDSSIESKDYLFVDNRYKKEFEEGVYKIDKRTGQVEYFK
jgi:hypothetical protein